jgi:DUF4097 and DUF4098 domain-containing protein YvlB
MNRYLSLTILALLGAAGCVNASDEGAAINTDVSASDAATHTVNGLIRVHAGKKSGDVTTVNGSIRIDADATVSAVRTVNGDIQVGAHATVQALHSVNGAIALDAGTRVNETVTSVNGALTLREDAQVGGAVSNVNGDIVLTRAHVAGDITTVNGGINLQQNSRVEGGILVRRKSSSGWFNREGNPPRIVIGPGSAVQGELKFERKVQLYVSDSATIGPISGATPIRFSGESPLG